MYKPSSKDKLTFEKLREINKEVIGWIDIYDTKIDYPIVQSKDNEKYLNTTVLGEFSSGGSIFLDYRNKWDFSDYQNIVYGHYMAERKMFGDIEKFLDENFFKSHKYGAIYKKDGASMGITFVALVKTDGMDENLLSPKVGSESKKRELVKYVKEKSTFLRTGDELKKFEEGENNVVILDTCDLTVTNGRHILVGYLTEKVEKNPYGEKENPHKKKIKLPEYKGNILKILLIIWIVLVFLLLIERLKINKKAKNMSS